MINSSKSNFLTYAIILLLVVNIGVIGSVLYQKHYFHKSMRGCCPPDKGMSQNRCLSDFLDKDLKFSKSQMEQFREFKGEFHSNAKHYFDSLDILESDFFTELEKPQADTLKLYSFADKFGQLQFALKRETIQHLIKIKSICTPEQQKKYFDQITKNRHCRGDMGMPSPAKKHDCNMMK